MNGASPLSQLIKVGTWLYLRQVTARTIGHPPGSGSIKLNFDGAAQGNPKPAGYGGVARDHKGHVMGVYWGDLGERSNNFAELEGLVHGLCWVNINGWSPLLVDMHRVCRGIY